ncbi:MAG: hypothetical protein JWL68_2423 [Actinomycetia bacterium]|nr:hypothetical protein [Actinomycetes bacterium]
MLSLLGRRSPLRAAGRNNPLIRYAGNGVRLDYCRELVPLGLDQVRDLGRSRSLDASSIRNILTGADKPDPPQLIDPRGVVICGAWIRGELNLDGVNSAIGLRFTGCRFEKPLSLADARLPWLFLDTCVLPAVVANRARVDTLSIRGCELDGRRPDGLIQLAGAQVTSELRLDGTGLANRSGPALTAPGLSVGGGGTCVGAFLDGLDAAGHSAGAAAVQLSGARVSGNLMLRGARLANRSGPALAADGLIVQGDLLLARDAASGRDFWASGGGWQGTVLLRGATISGQLSLERAKVRSGPGEAGPGPAEPAEPARSGGPGPAAGRPPWAGDDPPPHRRRSVGAVCLSGSTIAGNLVLRHAQLAAGTMSALMAENLTVKGHAGACESRQEGLTATGSGPLGAVCLAGASVTGQLSLRGTTLVNESGPALLADLIAIGDGARLDQDFSAEGEGEAGAVRLPEASIGGDLLLNGARLTNHTGPALLADGLTVHSDLVLDADVASGRRFEAAGAGRRGTILIRGATVSGRLSLEGAHVRRGHAPGSQPGQQVRDEIEQHSPAGLTAITAILRGCDCEPAGGNGSLGAVCLSNTTVGGRLAMRNAFLCNDTGPALMADYLIVKNDAAGCEVARNGLTAIGAGPAGAVCLAAATINGQLSLSGSTLANATGPALIADFAQIQGEVLLDQGFVAVGTGPAGAVSFTDASVGRELRCAGRFVSPVGEPPDGTARDAPGADGTARAVALNLTRTRTGTLQLGDQHHGFRLDGLLELDGLSYTGLPGLGDLDRLDPRPPGGRGTSRRGGRAPGPHVAHVGQWLWWLRECSAEYRAQPYEALAAAYGGAGYDDLARRILVAQRDDVRDRGSLSPVRTLGQHCAKWLIGYGYHCFYAFLWLAGLFTVTALIAVFWLGPDKYIVAEPAAGTPATAAATASPPASTAAPAAAAPAAPAQAAPTPVAAAPAATPSAPVTPSASASPSASPAAPPPRSPATATRSAAAAARECSNPARIGYAIELAFPVINLNSSSAAQCDVPATGAAAGVVVFGWLVRAAAAALLALYTLGLAGITRSPPGGG